ncbi:hypothetical protein NFI96_034269, partial [Prochilodus magdalenae]
PAEKDTKDASCFKLDTPLDSICPNVLEAFPLEDHAKGIRDLDFEDGATFIQHSLGLCWDLKHDIFSEQPIRFSRADCASHYTREVSSEGSHEIISSGVDVRGGGEADSDRPVQPLPPSAEISCLQQSSFCATH